MEALQIIWFVLLAVLLIGYAILDGFDLGVGFWHLFYKKDEERRTLLQSIGPFWDGNEVWLLTGGGAMFAAFPPVYASVFSGFYLALMLLLLALIGRAAAIEFRSQEESTKWRSAWDVVFSVGSSVAALLFGVALGNILNGIPLNEAGDYTGGFFGLLNPYALVIGLTGFAMILTHGALYIAIKTNESMSESAFSYAKISWFGFVALFVVATILSFVMQPQHLTNYKAAPVLWVLPIIAVAVIVLTGLYTMKKKAVLAFLLSSVTIFCMFVLTAVAIFPALVPASNDPALSLTVFKDSSSSYALSWMLGIAVVGVPLVLAYTFWVYKTFAGKVEADEESHGY